MGYIGTPIDTRNQFQSLQGKRFNGDGSTTDFTLDVAPSSTLDLEVFVGNVRQDPNSAYTVSGTTLSFTGAPPSGTNNIYVVHQAKSVGTITPGANSVGVTELNLSDGSNGQFISTNGSGTLSFASVTTPAVTALNNATANELVTVGSTTTELDAEANLTFDGTQLVLTDSNEGTDNLLVKTTSDNSISIALEKSDFKYDLGLDHNNDGSQNFYIRERHQGGSNTNAKRLVMDANGDIYLPDESDSGRIQIMTSYTNPQIIIYGPTNSNTTKMSFRNGNGAVGTIATNGSATAYNTSSDYRLKENEVAISDGITRLKQLKPYKFNFKIDADTKVDGFFAHEVSSIVPEAITGEKDGAEMQGIDQSKLVPLLTAALQEAVTKIETLEAKVKALEEA